MAPKPSSFINQSSAVWYRSEFDERISWRLTITTKMMVASSHTLTHTRIAPVFSHQFSHFEHKRVHSFETEICAREYTILKNFN